MAAGLQITTVSLMLQWDSESQKNNFIRWIMLRLSQYDPPCSFLKSNETFQRNKTFMMRKEILKHLSCLSSALSFEENCFFSIVEICSFPFVSALIERNAFITSSFEQPYLIIFCFLSLQKGNEWAQDLLMWKHLLQQHGYRTTLHTTHFNKSNLQKN